MKRVPFISGLLLLAGLGLSALAFHPILPFFRSSSAPAAAITPTNLPGGFSAYTWYEPSISGYVTNTGVATLSNLTSFGSVYDLTNSTAAAFPVKQTAMLNALDTLYFSGAGSPPRLFAKSWSNTSPFEVFVVLSITNTGSKVILRDTNDGGALATNLWSFSQGNTTMSLSQGATSITGAPITNKYVVLDLVYSNANSFIYTNNIQSKTGAAGTNFYLQGLMIGSDNQPANGVQMSFASLFTFSNQILSAAARLSAFQYCTQRFNIGP